MAASRQLTFHLVGDTGGVRNPVPQQIVTLALAQDVRWEDPARFLGIMGDVVYYYGERSSYYPQSSPSLHSPSDQSTRAD